MPNTNFISTVNNANFDEEVLERSLTTPVLVDFWAGWCNPCKILMPLLAKLAEEYQGKFHLAKIDTEQEKQLTDRFQIRSLPTVKIFKLGEVVDEFTGVLPEANIRDFINKHQVNEDDIEFQSAFEAFEANNQDEAISILEAILKRNNSHPNSLMLLARIELALGNNQRVDELLNHIPLQLANEEQFHQIKILNDFSKEITDIQNVEDLKQQLDTSEDISLQYKLACYFTVNKQYEAALENFISIMQKDRKFKDDGARKSILAIFEILGGAGPLVNIYRIKMSRLLH